MGQKVNPHGLRVGVIKNWDSRWFADKSTFGDTLVEDFNIRKLNIMKKKLLKSEIFFVVERALFFGSSAAFCALFISFF